MFTARTKRIARRRNGGFDFFELYIGLFRQQEEIATPARPILSNFGTKKIGTRTIDPVRIPRYLRAFVKILAAQGY